MKDLTQVDESSDSEESIGSPTPGNPRTVETHLLADPAPLHKLSSQPEERGPSENRHAPGYISNLLASWEHRQALLLMLMLPDTDRQGLSSTQLNENLEDFEAQIQMFLTHILNSRDARLAAQQLEGSNAQSFIDAVQDVCFSLFLLYSIPLTLADRSWIVGGFRMQITVRKLGN